MTLITAYLGYFTIFISTVYAAVGRVAPSLPSLALFKNINITITLNTLSDNLVDLEFDIGNSLPLPFLISQVVAPAGANGTVYVDLNYTFPTPLVLPSSGTVNSGVIANILLTQGAVATLDIIPLSSLQVFNATFYLTNNSLPYLLGPEIQNVPTSWNLTLED